MMSKSYLSIVSWIMSLLLLTAMQSAFAKDYGEFISEQYLRSQFVFSDGENLKYAECKKKSQSKCTYVWGVANKKDAKREKMGKGARCH